MIEPTLIGLSLILIKSLQWKMLLNTFRRSFTFLVIPAKTGIQSSSFPRSGVGMQTQATIFCGYSNILNDQVVYWSYKTDWLNGFWIASFPRSRVGMHTPLPFLYTPQITEGVAQHISSFLLLSPRHSCFLVLTQESFLKHPRHKVRVIDNDR